MFKGDRKSSGAEAVPASPGASAPPGPSRWLWKKGTGRKPRWLGGRPWARRFVVIVCSRDGVEPSAVLYFHAAPAQIDGLDMTRGPHVVATWENLASLTADEDAGVVLLDSAACKVRAVALGGAGGADRHGRFRFLIAHPKRGARVFACASLAERDAWVSEIRVAIDRGNEIGQGAKRRQLSIDEQQKRMLLVQQLETLLDEPDDHDGDALADGADDDDDLAEAAESGADTPRSTGATDDWSSTPSEALPRVAESDEEESDADEDIRQAERRLAAKQEAVAGVHGALNDYERALQMLVSARSALADAAILHENAFAADDTAPSSETAARRLARGARALREEALPAFVSVVRARVVKAVQSEAASFEGIHQLLRERQKAERALAHAKEKGSSSESQKQVVRLLAKEQELTAAEAEIKHDLAKLDARRRARLGDELAVLAACDRHVFGCLQAGAAEELHLTGAAAASAACELAVVSQRSRLASRGVAHRDAHADGAAPAVSRDAVLRALGEDGARRAPVARLIADTLGEPPPPPLERTGELEKRARSNFSRALWQPRFFALDAGTLAYFASAADAAGHAARDVAEDNRFDLAHCSVEGARADPDLWKARASDLEFRVKRASSAAGGGGERELHLRARSAAERDAWIAALAAHRQHAGLLARRDSDGDEDRERALAALARGECDAAEPALRGLVDAFLEAVEDDRAPVDAAALACVLLDGDACRRSGAASAPTNLTDDEIDRLGVRELRELVRRARMPCTGIIDKGELRRLAKHAAAHVRVRALSVRELRELIERAELSDADCVERAELQKRALQADLQLRGEDPNAIAEMLSVLDAAAVARAEVHESAREAVTTSPRQAAARRAARETVGDDNDVDQDGHAVLLARNDSGRVHFSEEARASDGSALPLDADAELDTDSRERVSSTLTFDGMFKEGSTRSSSFEAMFEKGGASEM